MNESTKKLYILPLKMVDLFIYRKRIIAAPILEPINAAMKEDTILIKGL